VTSATFVDDDTVASVSLDGTIRYWDTGPGPRNGVWSGHSGFVYSVAYHPDGKHVVSGSWDSTVRVWDETGREVRRFDLPERLVVEREDEKIMQPERVTGLAVHPAGKWVATVSWGDNVHLWDYDTGALLQSWVRKQQHWMTGRVAFHPTADLLACGGGRPVVSVYDPRTKKTVVELETKADAVSDVAFSPDGKLLVAAGCSDRTVHVWEVATWAKVATLTGAKDACYSLAFTPDGRTLASGSVDGNVYLWDVGTWQPTATLRHGVKVYGLAYTPDGGRLACGCADNTVRLWDTTRHTQVAELRGHSDYIHQLAFNRDGRRLVTASGDLTLRAWDATPKE
jgi:WD40 repeat protein